MFAFIEASAIREDETRVISENERRAALAYLGSIIRAGEQGLVEPNLLFNASVLASQMEMYAEAVKLAVLAVHGRPSVNGRILVLEMADLFGKTYNFIDGKIVAIEQSAEVLRAEIWAEVLAMIKEAPGAGAEQICSRAANIAERNNTSGYYDSLIQAIKVSAEASDKELTSYGYMMLADMTSRRGGKNWKEEFLAAIGKSLDRLKIEPPRSTWYPHSVREIVDSARKADVLEELIPLISSRGAEDLFQ